MYTNELTDNVCHILNQIMKKNISIILFLVGIILSLGYGRVQTSGTSEAKRLFKDAPVPGTLDFADRPEVLMTRFVNIHFDFLKVNIEQGGAFNLSHTLNLNLFPGLFYIAEIEKIPSEIILEKVEFLK